MKRFEKKFQSQLFKLWIKQNRSRFKYPVYLKVHRNHYQIVFHGITQKMYFR
jgi:hypothetical protein